MQQAAWPLVGGDWRHQRRLPCSVAAMDQAVPKVGTAQCAAGALVRRSGGATTTQGGKRHASQLGQICPSAPGVGNMDEKLAAVCHRQVVYVLCNAAAVKSSLAPPSGLYAVCAITCQMTVAARTACADTAQLQRCLVMLMLMLMRMRFVPPRTACCGPQPAATCSCLRPACTVQCGPPPLSCQNRPAPGWPAERGRAKCLRARRLRGLHAALPELPDRVAGYGNWFQLPALTGAGVSDAAVGRSALNRQASSQDIKPGSGDSNLTQTSCLAQHKPASNAWHLTQTPYTCSEHREL